MPRPPRRTRRLTIAAQQKVDEGGHHIDAGTHGTVWTPGQTTVEPSSVAGTTPTFQMSETDRAYFTAHHPDPITDQSEAQSRGWSWANSAAHNRPDPEGKSLHGRPVVHEVEPEGRIDHDNNMGDYVHGSMTADRLHITDTHWIRPPKPGEIAVQGTLPHINWNQHAHVGLSHLDLNNPGISQATGHMEGTVEHDDAVWRGVGKELGWPNQPKMHRKLVPGGSPAERQVAEGKGPKTGLPGDDDGPPQAEQQRLF